MQELAESDVKPAADAMLRHCRVLDTLAEFGEPLIHGSYELDLMMRPEVDIWLFVDGLRSEVGPELVLALHQHVAAKTAMMLNEVDFEARHGPTGAFLIDYRLMHEGIEWKLDIAVCPSEQRSLANYNGSVLNRITPETRASITAIKRQTIRSPRYRKSRWSLVGLDESFGSRDIIKAVLDHGVGSLDEFADYLRFTRDIELFDEAEQPFSDLGSVGDASRG